MSAYPKSLLSIVASVGGLAVFLVLASLLMVSQPIGPTLGRFFYGVDHSENIDTMSLVNGTLVNSPSDGDITKDLTKSNLHSTKGDDHEILVSSHLDDQTFANPLLQSQHPTSKNTYKNSMSGQNVNLSVTSFDNATVSESEEMVDQQRGNYGASNEGKDNDVPLSANETVNVPQLSKEVSSSVSPVRGNISKTHSGHSDCDLYHGQWIYDPTGPLYSNSCPVLTQMQNCQGNGRPDREYENWRWKPEHCDLPRFDPKKFLELMRGKTLAFVGDSVARNQMESLLCILWQVEVPKNRGNRRRHRYYFRSTSTMIVRIWSSWLVHKTPEPFDFAPAGVDKVFLDAPDEVFMEFVPQFDVIVLSSGHWFAKKSAYILNNKILGGQLWWPDKSRPKQINNVKAFGISVETILTSLGTHPNFTGLAIVRSYSPDHYVGGAWNTGGSCTGKVKPILASEMVQNGFTKIMHKKQVDGFNLAMKKKINKSKLRLMDITEAFSYRQDGHPGPYRSPDAPEKTKRGGGKSHPQDCLHWCMPGPVDTWNELMLEIIRREYEGGAGPL